MLLKGEIRGEVYIAKGPEYIHGGYFRKTGFTGVFARLVFMCRVC